MPPDVLGFRKVAPIQFKTVTDLKGKRIGVVFGYTYPTLEPLFNAELKRMENDGRLETILSKYR